MTDELINLVKDNKHEQLAELLDKLSDNTKEKLLLMAVDYEVYECIKLFVLHEVNVSDAYDFAVAEGKNERILNLLKQQNS